MSKNNENMFFNEIFIVYSKLRFIVNLLSALFNTSQVLISEYE